MSLPIKFFYWLPFYDCLLRCSYHFSSLRKGERLLHPCLCEISQGKSTYRNSDKLNNHVEWVVKDALIINWGKQFLKYCLGPETRLVDNVNYRLQSVRWIQTPTRVGLWWIQKKMCFLSLYDSNETKISDAFRLWDRSWVQNFVVCYDLSTFHFCHYQISQ